MNDDPVIVGMLKVRALVRFLADFRTGNTNLKGHLSSVSPREVDEEAVMEVSEEELISAFEKLA
ncbi:hypothetical protein KIN20_022368 [Parelaphostrongylus tenuis]|uniref:Uncharacterized protein n=1 Tax=Parelaphostrongylus tenuis TaxID=148309 RepID=A0AAD5QVB0_PARTN|nr:hypothetical protein KIN20_022368 [Parelaphostrongylus tenuis]